MKHVLAFLGVALGIPGIILMGLFIFFLFSMLLTSGDPTQAGFPQIPLYGL